MDVMPLLAEGGSFAGSTHLVVERQPRYQRTTAQVELLFLCLQHSRLSKTAPQYSSSEAPLGQGTQHAAYILKIAKLCGT